MIVAVAWTSADGCWAGATDREPPGVEAMDRLWREACASEQRDCGGHREYRVMFQSSSFVWSGVTWGGCLNISCA